MEVSDPDTGNNTKLSWVLSKRKMLFKILKEHPFNFKQLAGQVFIWVALGTGGGVGRST
jgi:hypothetical protein